LSDFVGEVGDCGKVFADFFLKGLDLLVLLVHRVQVLLDSFISPRQILPELCDLSHQFLFSFLARGTHVLLFSLDLRQ